MNLKSWFKCFQCHYKQRIVVKIHLIEGFSEMWAYYSLNGVLHPLKRHIEDNVFVSVRGAESKLHWSF